MKDHTIKKPSNYDKEKRREDSLKYVLSHEMAKKLDDRFVNYRYVKDTTDGHLYMKKEKLVNDLSK